jgi:tetratricopeptide (TPR) repeat protein
LWDLSLSRCEAGEYDAALRCLHDCLTLAKQVDGQGTTYKTYNTLGWVYLDLCNWDLALQYNTTSAAESRSIVDPEIARNAELNVADCYLALGRLDDAQRILEATERDCAVTGTWGETWMKWRYTQHLHASLGELWLARGDPTKAIEYADRCLEAAVATTSRRNIVKGRRLKGEALLAQGQAEAAEAELCEALAVARYVGNPAQLRLTLAALGRLRTAQARPGDAAAAYREVIAIVERVAASLSDQALRDTLLASAQVRSVREALAACEH